MKISVLLPVFNEELYIEKCIDSLLGQDYENIEICISDNASNDNTWEIIDRYHNQDDRVVAVRQDEPIHPIDNLKSALLFASGDYVFVMGGDDYLLPGFFSAAVSLLRSESDPASIVCARMHYFKDIDGEVFATLPPVEFESEINGSVRSLLDFFLRHINHDELVLSLSPRAAFESAMGLLGSIDKTTEALGMWVFLGVALSVNTVGRRVSIPVAVHYMKRYEKVTRDDSSYHNSERLLLGRSSAYLKGLYGSFYVIVRFYRAGFLSLGHALLMLFAFRYHNPNGLCFAGPVIDPIYRVYRKLSCADSTPKCDK